MIKAENIAAKEFRKSLYGYDCEQVDRYLDDIIVQLKQMEQERLEMAATIEYLAGQVEGGERKQTQHDRIVAPISPHRLLSDTGRRRLAEAADDAANKKSRRPRILPGASRGNRERAAAETKEKTDKHRIVPTEPIEAWAGPKDDADFRPTVPEVVADAPSEPKAARSLETEPIEKGMEAVEPIAPETVETEPKAVVIEPEAEPVEAPESEAEEATDTELDVEPAESAEASEQETEEAHPIEEMPEGEAEETVDDVAAQEPIPNETVGSETAEPIDASAEDATDAAPIQAPEPEREEARFPEQATAVETEAAMAGAEADDADANGMTEAAAEDEEKEDSESAPAATGSAEKQNKRSKRKRKRR